LLERGALEVYAIDVGHNQLDWRIRSDPRVRVLEHINAKHLTPESVPEPVQRVVMDVSFISLTKVVEGVRRITQSPCEWIMLIKPQFVVGREKVGKGGIVRDPLEREKAVSQVTAALEELGFARQGLIESPITGTQGNQEYLSYWRT
jgi:23S rRNA (cytidine1920-2'-O)/16S rRNA (cytidine1409-2'-O)-methyltransferase